MTFNVLSLVLTIEKPNSKNLKRVGLTLDTEDIIGQVLFVRVVYNSHGELYRACIAKKIVHNFLW
jgi:hypothetical protein